MTLFRSLVVGGTLFLALNSCQRDGEGQHSAPAVPVDSGPPAVGVGDVADSTCPRTGRWATCHLEDRLEDAGLAPRREDTSVRQPFFSVAGVAYKIGTADLHVYLYESEQAAT